MDEPRLVNKIVLAGTGQKGAVDIAEIVEPLTIIAKMNDEDQELYLFCSGFINEPSTAILPPILCSSIYQFLLLHLLSKVTFNQNNFKIAKLSVRSIIYFLLIFGASNYSKAQVKITVAVAANMKYASEALKTAFEQAENIKVDLIIGSSGQLTQQIMSSAPFDVFISADTSFPQKLFDGNYAVKAPQVYARGLLVLWTLKQNVQLNSNLQFMLLNTIKSIAMANPKNAPYGYAAETLLKKYNLFDKVKQKIVLGESITQTSQFIATRAADVGFTAKAVVLSKEMKGKGVWLDLDPKDYPPIKQAAILLKYGQKNHAQAATKFYNFLYSAKAKNILTKYGYII